MTSHFRIVFLSSGKGTTVSAFCKELENDPQIKLAGIVSDRPEPPVASVAKAFHLPFTYVEPDASFDSNLLETLRCFQPTLICLAGFLKKVPPQTLGFFKNRVINSHPSLLPRFGGQGFYGRKVHEAVIASGDKETGVTIHLVNEEYDKGPILQQASLEVLKGESAEDLEERVKKLEKRVYIDTVKTVLKGLVAFED